MGIEVCSWLGETTLYRGQKLLLPAKLVYIIVGQTALLSLALGFLAAVRANGHIPLAQGPAIFFEENPQAKTYIVTFLATTLSTFSSFLFTQAVRHAIVISLTRPVPISTLGFGILISRKSLIFNREYKWVVISAVLFLATLAQTARQHYIESSLLSIVDQSGAASATAQAGYPALVDFGGWAHDTSTRGIFPIQLQDFTDTAGDVNLRNLTKLSAINNELFPPSISAITYAMSQQGLGANVSCRTADLDETTDPPLVREAQPYGDFTYWNVSTVCSDDGYVSVGAFSSNNNTLFSINCHGNVDNSGKLEPTYTAIIDGQNAYSGTFVCSVTPQIQNTITNYTDSIISSHFDESSTPVPAKDIGWAALYAVSAAVNYGQSELRNSIGDSIQAIFADEALYGKGTTDGYLELLEAYISGIVEFTGTAIKTNLTLVGGPFNGNPPANMTRYIAGHATVSTVGWQYNTVTSSLVLIPAVFVGLVCIFITLVAQWYNRGIPLHHADFDPNNPWRLMAAASAGGMTSVFHGVDEDHVKEGLENRVMLGQVGGRDGFVHV
ncbi:hypothetical protein GGX14DRAFT_588523 [Mycena pura]|uniref:Uncharacterized protein n=1 Tax=Mycena pura TaxID=153505 RepID=A0AAD6Y2I9_9AGAR|nr:hypothetical protein GGX14DRAFT_588523 [Mycena pura]